MKKKILLFLVLLTSILTTNAQTWNGTNPIWTLSNVGIGTASADAPLTVYGITNIYPRMTGSVDIRSFSINYALRDPIFIDNNYPIVLTTGGGNQPLILDAPRVGIGTITPGTKLDVKGPAHFSGNYNMQLTAGEGTYINWNQSGEMGETNFINHRGQGVGGFAFYNTNNTTTGNMLMFLSGAGNLGLGTTTPDAKLAVNRTIHSKEVKVDMNFSTWPDYVFQPSYHLLSLPEVKRYIDKHQHLPDMPSEKEVMKEGLNLGEMNKLLVKKIEELTLYLIEQNKVNQTQQEQINKLTSKVAELTK